MKKLLITTDCFLPRWDGVSRFLSEVIPKLKDEFEITVLAPMFEGKYKEIEGVNVIRLPLYAFQIADIRFTKINYSKIKANVKEADIVFNQTIGTVGFLSILAAKKYNKPIVSYIHSIEWELSTKSVKRFKKLANVFARLMARYIYNKCDMLLVPYREVMEKYKKNKIHVAFKEVNLGINTNKFIPADKTEAKQKIGIEPDKLIIGFHGRIGREKNLITLYRAFKRLEKKYPNVRLMIVGKGVDEEQQMFSSDRNIIVHESKPNVVPYVQAMDIYVLPSLTETTSLSTLEAMSCSVAVVATPVGYVKEYIEEKENGMFFPFKNSLRLMLKLEMLITDQSLRERLGKNARITVINHFSWEKSAEQIKQVLKSF